MISNRWRLRDSLVELLRPVQETDRDRLLALDENEPLVRHGSRTEIRQDASQRPSRRVKTSVTA